MKYDQWRTCLSAQEFLICPRVIAFNIVSPHREQIDATLISSRFFVSSKKTKRHGKRPVFTDGRKWTRAWNLRRAKIMALNWVDAVLIAALGKHKALQQWHVFVLFLCLETLIRQPKFTKKIMDYDVNSRRIYCNPDTENCVYLSLSLSVCFEQQLICPNSQILNLSAVLTTSSQWCHGPLTMTLRVLHALF